MGYYTNYSIEVVNADKVTRERITEAAASLEYFDPDSPAELDALGNPFEYIEQDMYTWYDYADDMRALSLKFPEMIFRVYGEGETNGDIWVHYFHNGTDQRNDAEIVFPPAPAWANC